LLNIDKEIIAKAKEGERKAMGEIYVFYKDYVLRSAYFILGKHDEAEDVMENVFFKVFTKIHTFNMEKDFKPWLSRIILNESRNLYHRRKAIYDNADLLMDQISEKESSPELRLDLKKHLSQMDYESKELIMMRFYQDLTLEEIARIKRITINNVKVRIHRALKKLKEFVKIDA